MSTPEIPREHADRWELHPLRGVRVTRITVDFRLVLALGPDWEVVLEAPADLSYETADALPPVRLHPESQDVAEALPLVGARVLSATASTSGTLSLVFDAGRHLTCPPDPSFEAWQVTGPSGWRFVALPGGELGAWPGLATEES
ncbi:DUF6188 family protein [Streptomyces sp. NPDC127049]|uniref:DUF6188 family protein n=1 Tax=Streptomyces sp. NPDC127049 TaxID=3347118 RepID=UPI0036509A87